MLRVRAVNLEVTHGPDQGRRARIDRPTFILGTGEAADLRLSDGTVSREHLRITLSPSGVQLRDEGSKTGSWIGGLRISDVIMTRDTAVELGTTSIALHVEAGPLDLPLSANAKFGQAI